MAPGANLAPPMGSLLLASGWLGVVMRGWRGVVCGKGGGICRGAPDAPGATVSSPAPDGNSSPRIVASFSPGFVPSTALPHCGQNRTPVERVIPHEEQNIRKGV